MAQEQAAAGGREIGESMVGSGPARVDGRLKVTGGARYGADARPANTTFAYLVTSPIAKGKIDTIDDQAAKTVPGFVALFTHENVGKKIDTGKIFDKGGYMGTSIAPLADASIHHDGQILALVVGETFEAAREAAQRLSITYKTETPTAGFDQPGTEIGEASKESAMFNDPKVGDAEQGLKEAAVVVAQDYATAMQHHNPLELFGSTCAWDGDKLTVWESTQNTYGFQHGLAMQLGIEPKQIHWITPFIGGGFGSRGPLGQHTALVAFAAKQIGRPVTLEATRDQCFTIATYRAETRHKIKLGATKDGKLTAYTHEGWEVSSRPDAYKVGGTTTNAVLYDFKNIDTKVHIVHADRNTPGFMRSPPEVPYLFALECAMDELAEQLAIDPIELRRRNDTKVDAVKKRPFTSRHLMECFDAGAKQFGWDKRNAKPKMTRDGDWLVGYGTATTTYPTNQAPATARVIVTADGRAKVQTAGHEIGVGIYTVLTQVAADGLGLPMDKITVELGDSNFPPAPVSGGSNSTASLCTVVAKACTEAREKIAAAAVSVPNGLFHGQNPKDLRIASGAVSNNTGGAGNVSQPIATVLGQLGGAIEAYAENIPHGGKPTDIQGLYQGKSAMKGGEKLDDRLQFAFGAQFAEVQVHSRTGEIRVPRALGCYAAGKIINPRLAHSQLMGGIIWGIGCALHEGTEIDVRAARYMNDDLADYLIPVNADIQDIEVLLLPEDDTEVNELGIKGIGELGNVGMNAAVVNAIYNATGVRVRHFPVRIEDLLSGLDV